MKYVFMVVRTAYDADILQRIEATDDPYLEPIERDWEIIGEYDSLTKVTAAVDVYMNGIVDGACVELVKRDKYNVARELSDLDVVVDIFKASAVYETSCEEKVMADAGLVKRYHELYIFECEAE